MLIYYRLLFSGVIWELIKILSTCRVRMTVQSRAINDVVAESSSTKQVRNFLATNNDSSAVVDRRNVDVNNDLSSSANSSLPDDARRVDIDIASWLSMSLREKLSLLQTSADDALTDDIASADALRNVVTQSRDASADDLASIWVQLAQIVSRQAQDVQRLMCAVLHESSSLGVLLSSTINVIVNWNFARLGSCNDVVQLAVVSAFRLRDVDWSWLVESSAEWRRARYMPAGLLRQIDSVRQGESMPLLNALKKASNVDRLNSVAPLWLLSRRRCCLLSLDGGACWKKDVSVVDRLPEQLPIHAHRAIVASPHA